MDGPPLISVIVPTHDRLARLRSCLDALAGQAYPPERFEVIVVDDGGEAPVEPVAEAVADRLSVRVIRAPRGGPASARNRGAAAASGELLAFTDDDCRPAPTWLHALEDAFRAEPQAMVGGEVRNALPHNPYSAATQHIVSYIAERSRRRAPGAEGLFTTSNLALPATRFRALGGFSTDFRLPGGEDYDLCDRFRHAGGRIAYAPDAVVMHEHSLDLRSFVRQHLAYGRGALRLRVRRARRSGSTLRGESPRFYGHLLVSSLRQGRGWHWRQVSLVALAQVATAAGVLAEVGRSLRGNDR